MALALLLQASSEGRSSPGAHRNRWTFALDLPTTLRESQLAIVGCVLPSARGGAQQPQCQDEAAQAADQQADDAEVATIEQISSGWQLTRHGACVKIAVRRAFGGHEVQLPMLGSTALLCHGDEVRFSPPALRAAAAATAEFRWRGCRSSCRSAANVMSTRHLGTRARSSATPMIRLVRRTAPQRMNSCRTRMMVRQL